MATTDARPLRFRDEHRPQKEFVQSDARYTAFISGVGAGKTVGGIGRLIRNVSSLNPGYTGFVVSPTVPSLRTTVIPELEKWGVLDRCEFNRSEKRLDFPNGSTVFLDSADNERKIKRLRGPSIAWFWIDEAATVDKRAWDILIARLRDGDHLNAFITTTPKGENWVYERFVKDNPDDVRAITGVASHANPHLPDDYEEITGEYDGRFYQQEVEGAFVGFSGLVYPWFDRETHVVSDLPERYDETIYGVDWGHSSPAAMLACVRSGGQWVVAEEFYERRCTVDDLAARLEGMASRWGEGRIYCDPAEPASIEHLKRAGLPARAAENDVMPGIQRVTALQDDLRVHQACQNLRNEFAQYQYRDPEESDDVLKENDHAMDALRYALFTHYQPDDGPTAKGVF